MAECIVINGGGGADLDVVTAGKPDVLAGKVIVDKDGEPLTGTMPNRGAVSAALNAGGSYSITEGYHNGSGKVTSNSLASQTPGTATAARIMNGDTAWVNGSKLTGTMTVNSILSFSAAAYSTNQILLQWRNPYAASGKPFSGVFINYSTSGYPGQLGGTRIYTGVGNNSAPGSISQVIVTLPTPGVTYYFSVCAYASCSSGDLWGAVFNASAATTARGQQIFTSSGTFTIPSNVRSIDVFCVGGGGGGGGGYYRYDSPGGGGGGGGYTATKKSVSVNPGDTYAITIGAGGVRGWGDDGEAGGLTSFGTLCSAPGGLGGRYYGSCRGGKGGSGGGCGDLGPGAGGSNGGTGGGAYPGTGQGTSTRAFGEVNNTLYAGGGGGGGGASYYGAAGAGGGGRGGGGPVGAALNGTANTGGGGGGGMGHSKSDYRPGGYGGSGICIIRWGY